MSDIIIQDNFLNKEYFKELQDEVLSENFAWYMSGINEKRNNIQDYQMAHSILAPRCIVSSDFFHKLGVLFDTLECTIPIRIKINLLKREEKIIEHGMHIDFINGPENALVSILYMNTNNGYTKFENGEKVKSVENRLVTFPNSLRHTGSTNTCKAPYRCVMNIDWIKKLNNGEIK